MTEKQFLNQIDLSRRWGVSPRTLERWRWMGEGPKFLKLGGRVVYPMAEVTAYEEQQLRESTSQNGPERWA